MSAMRDRIVDLLPAERPSVLRRLPREELAWRARYSIIARGAGAPEPLAWALAMSMDPEFVASAPGLVAEVTDEAIADIARSLPDDGHRASFWRLGERSPRSPGPPGRSLRRWLT